MTVAEAEAEFGRILGNLAALRRQYQVYGDDWGIMPTSVKNAVKARVATVTAQASADLAALSTAIQAQ